MLICFFLFSRWLELKPQFNAQKISSGNIYRTVVNFF